LLQLLKDRQAEGAQIRQKLEIYPAVLFGDYELDSVYPHTIVAHFAILSRDAHLTAASGEPLVSVYALQLPNGFYRKLKQNEFKTYWDLDAFVDKIKSADIFVLGAGNVSAPLYRYKITDQLGTQTHVENLLKKDNSIMQVLYTPLSKDGTPDKEISSKIIGVTVKHVKHVADDPQKRVILVAGGEQKIEGMQRIIKFPCYNVLVTDVGVAEAFSTSE
jgi:hypothetical protein